jgi:hypothetical protein
MTAPISSDPMIQLAEMMLDHDALAAKLDAENMRAARADQHRAIEQEVSALHEAADDLRRGALVEGGLALGGAALSSVGHVLPKDAGALACTLTNGMGAAAQALSRPTGSLLGAAPQADAQAEAKRYEANAADAEARAEEARHHRDRADQAADRTLDSVGATLASETQGNLAIIANV